MLTVFFFFNDTATTEIYTLSLHDALPIWGLLAGARRSRAGPCWASAEPRELGHESVPTSCTRMRLVEPGVLGGLPTTTTTRSPSLSRPMDSSEKSTCRTMSSVCCTSGTRKVSTPQDKIGRAHV